MTRCYGTSLWEDHPDGTTLQFRSGDVTLILDGRVVEFFTVPGNQLDEFRAFVAAAMAVRTP